MLLKFININKCNIIIICNNLILNSIRSNKMNAFKVLILLISLVIISESRNKYLPNLPAVKKNIIFNKPKFRVFSTLYYILSEIIYETYTLYIVNYINNYFIGRI